VRAPPAVPRLPPPRPRHLRAAPLRPLVPLPVGLGHSPARAPPRVGLPLHSRPLHGHAPRAGVPTRRRDPNSSRSRRGPGVDRS
jgi:hypothetical protein